MQTFTPVWISPLCTESFRFPVMGFWFYDVLNPGCNAMFRHAKLTQSSDKCTTGPTARYSHNAKPVSPMPHWFDNTLTSFSPYPKPTPVGCARWLMCLFRAQNRFAWLVPSKAALLRLTVFKISYLDLPLPGLHPLCGRPRGEVTVALSVPTEWNVRRVTSYPCLSFLIWTIVETDKENL